MRSIKTRYFVFHPLAYSREGSDVQSLARVGFRTRSGRALLLHYFPAHESRTFHDHPWHFRTLVLFGGYEDLSPCEKCAGTGYESPACGNPRKCARCDGSGVLVDRLGMFSTRYRPAKHRHRTRVKRRAVTIVLTGPTEREWCEGLPGEWTCGGVEADFTEGLGMRR